MKGLAFFCMMLIGFALNADAAVPQQRRGGGTTSPVASTTSTRTGTVSARSATTARSATSARSAATPAVSARAATTGRATVDRGTASTTSSGTSSTTARSAVVARAGATQKVIGTGTKVAAAAENVIVSAECRQKYMGCMDSFCMLDNASGGRCICSDKNAELNDVLAQIEELDQRSYQMATYGVERIEMGDSADAVIASANAVAQSIIDADKEEEEVEEKRGLDLSLWSNPDYLYDTADIDIFNTAFEEPVEEVEGDDLYAAADEICVAQIPECANEMSMLKLMYQQQIRSDCTAYENSLKQQKNASAQKLAAAETALRDAALEQYQSANKYDLGQCVVEFKNCMIDTGGCGDDFAGCASVVAFDATNTRGRGEEAKIYRVKGAVTDIEISASTYDILMSKKTLCESVTKQCVAVADQVWDTFLREVAPQVKSAELIAEDNSRQNCISNISACFQQACKDTMDPNDPEGSYDLCLTRPETMLNLCQVPLNACGINTTDPEESDGVSSLIWDFVLARLQSMRVNSCTTQVKQCLQSQDRCGADYTQCLGLDIDTIMELCPLESLVGCQQTGSDGKVQTTKEDIRSLITGISLSIDNALLDQCKKAADAVMVNVCGDTATCATFSNDNIIGTGSLVSRKNSSGDYVIDGLISFSNIRINQKSENDIYNINTDEYMKTISGASQDVQNRIRSTIDGIAQEVQRRVDVIASDPQVSMCINGRDISQIAGRSGERNVVNREETTTARFPHLLNAYTNVIAVSALNAAKANYDREYASVFSQANTASEEYQNQIYCTAMAQRDSYNNNLRQIQESGIKSVTPWEVVLSGVSSKKMLEALTSNAVQTNVLLDTDNRMIGRETVSSVYEPATQTCRITTTTYPCTGFSAIYNANSSSFNVEAGASAFGFGGSAGYGQSQSENTYQGNFCSSYAEPVISEQIINLGTDGEGVYETNTTRSNLQTYYNDQSLVTHTEGGGGGFSLSLGMGNLDLGDRSVENVNSNNVSNSNNAINSGNEFNDNSTTNNSSGGGASGASTSASADSNPMQSI